MEIKIVDRPLWKGIAILWFVCAAYQIWTAYTHFYYTGFPYSAISFILLGIFFLNTKNQTYVTLRDEILTIHLWLFRRKKKIRVEDIMEVEVLGKDIILHLYNGRTYNLKNEWIEHTDFYNMRKELEAQSVIFK